MRIYIIILAAVQLLLFGCSETYNVYEVNTSVNPAYEIVTDTTTWDIENFAMRELENTATGDTAQLSLVEVEIFDKSFPYPQKFTLRFYFNPLLDKMQATADFSVLGLIDYIELIEKDVNSDDIVIYYYVDKEKPFAPELSITNYNMKYNYISGTLEGAVYEKYTKERRNIRLEFKTVTIGK